MDAVRADPSPIGSAVNEVVHNESPVQAFGRVLTTGKRLGDGRLEAGERVVLLYGSANRDERRWG